MRLLVQWAQATPGGWEEVDSRAWRSTPKRPDPTGQSLTLDDAPGWISRINIQGLSPSADHYAVEHLDAETLRLTVWCDDPSWVTDGRFAVVWTIKTLAPDPLFDGAINTRQKPVVYAEGAALTRFTIGQWPDIRPWALFPKPAEDDTRHGKQVSDEAWDEHRRATPLRGWRNFTEGLDPSEIVDGVVPRQRRRRPGGGKDLRFPLPLGTITCYSSDTNLATGIHAATYEKSFLTSYSGSASGLQVTAGKGASGLGWCWTSPSGWPGSADWPSGNYRIQIDITANDYSSVALGSVGTATGHFARVNSGLTSDLQTWAQAESAFTGTGLKLATTGTIDPTAGSSSDRFECLVAWYNSSTKNSSITIDSNESDDYADGPWTPPPQSVNATAASTATGSSVNATVTPGAVSVSATASSTATGSSVDATVTINTLVQVDSPSTATGSSVAADVTPGAVNVSATDPATATGSSAAADVTPGAVLIDATASSTATGSSEDAGVTPGAVSCEATASDATGSSVEADVTPGAVQVDATSPATATGSTEDAAVSSGIIVDVDSSATATGSSVAADVTPGEVQVDTTEPSTATGSSVAADVTPGAVQTQAEAASSAVGSSAEATVTPGAVSTDASTSTATGSSAEAGVTPGAVSVDSTAAATATGDSVAADVLISLSTIAESAGASGTAQEAAVTPGAVSVEAPAPASATGSSAEASVDTAARAYAEASAGAIGSTEDGEVTPGAVQIAAQSAGARGSTVDASVAVDIVVVAQPATAAGSTCTTWVLTDEGFFIEIEQEASALGSSVDPRAYYSIALSMPIDTAPMAVSIPVDDEAIDLEIEVDDEDVDLDLDFGLE